MMVHEPASKSVGHQALRMTNPLRRWLSLGFTLVAFEIGLFLTIYPWMDWWSLNHISTWASPSHIALLEDFWEDPFFRGAVTGLGLTNLWIALQRLALLFKIRSKS